MTRIGFRVDVETEDYLSKTAKKNMLLTPSGNDVSLGGSARKIIEWCMKNDIDISKNINELSSETTKMIEQIHIALPHLMLLTRMNTQGFLDENTPERVKKIRASAVKYLNKTCGSFQSVYYENIKVSINDIGMKQVPEAEENTTWK